MNLKKIDSTLSFNKLWNKAALSRVFSRDNLSQMKNGSYVINLDEYADLGTNWIALFIETLKLFISIVLVLNMFLFLVFFLL